jgi:flagellin
LIEESIMAAVINTNISSLNAQRNLSASQGSLRTSLERLSSGLRVNGAKDDAAGLAIATRMTAQSRGMQVAIRNANDGISLAQTAEGALGQIKDHMLRMRDLSVQAANASNTSADRAQMDTEFQALSQEISRIYTGTSFNGIKILDTGAGTNSFQVGANSGETVDIVSNSLSGIYGAVSALSLSGTTAAGGSAAMAALDTQIDALSTERSTYGAAQSRFEGIVSILQVSQENQAAAASRIMDADYASETANLTRAQILQQAGTAMLAQANSLPNGVLTLLRG